MTPIDVVREYFPEVSDDDASSILWNYTGFPGFWVGDPETSMREQLQYLKDKGFEAVDAEFQAAADRQAMLIARERSSPPRAA